MNTFESWLLGLTCHLFCNRRHLIALVLAVPLVVVAGLKVWDDGRGDWTMEAGR